LELLKKVSERCPVEGAEGVKEGIEVVGRGKEEDIVRMRMQDVRETGRQAARQHKEGSGYVCLENHRRRSEGLYGKSGALGM